MSTGAIRLREAAPDSRSDVAALAMLRFTWRVDEGDESGEPAEFVTALEQWWRDHSGTHRAWLAERDAAPVGMAWLGVVHRVPGPERFVRLAGIVQSVYVLPSGRGAGTGGSLVGAVIAAARDEGLDYLTVHPSDRAYALYERAGFADTGRALELALR